MSFVSVEGRARLERVAKWLEDGAKHVVLDDKGVVREIHGFDMSETVSELPGCGTVCCIAGAVCQFEKPYTPDQMTEYTLSDGKFVGFYDDDNVMPRAIGLLGISQEDAELMFVPDEDQIGLPREELTAQEGALVIRHFLATGEVDWKLATNHRGECDY